MNSIALKEKAVRRFWSKVDKQDEDECWEWMAARTDEGYGAFSIQRTSIVAHRFSWELMHGKLPEGMLVCHKCDNPPCVNPHHLFLGTQKRNMEDKVQKGRAARGSKIGNAVLKENDVIEIKRLLECGLGPTEIARMYKVSQGAIMCIKSKRNWSWIG